MSKMRAVVATALGDFDNYSIKEIDCTVPSEGEVQIEVMRAGVTSKTSPMALSLSK